MTRKPPATERKMLTLMRQALAAGTARTEAARYQNDRQLSDEGNAAARRRLRLAANEQFDKDAAAILETARAAAPAIRAAAAAARPSFDANDPGALTRTAQAWQYSVLPRLERGEALADVLKTASVDAVLGAERFAVDYLSGPRDSGVNATIYDATGDVQRAVVRRFADLAETSDAAAAIVEGATVDTDLAALNDVVLALGRNDGLSASILVGHLASDGAVAAPEEAGDDAA